MCQSMSDISTQVATLHSGLKETSKANRQEKRNPSLSSFLYSCATLSASSLSFFFFFYLAGSRNTLSHFLCDNLNKHGDLRCQLCMLCRVNALLLFVLAAPLFIPGSKLNPGKRFDSSPLVKRHLIVRGGWEGLKERVAGGC